MTSAASVTISRLASTRSVPTRESRSWHELAALLSDPRATPCTTSTCGGSSCAHKGGACWSPAVFRADQRAAANVEAIGCLVLDVDHVSEVVLEGLREQLKKYQHLIHTTHADRLDDRCVRVVVQLSRAVAPSEWSRFWRAAVAALGAPTSQTHGDAARCYYLPSRPSDADYFVAVHVGMPFDVDQVLASAPDVVVSEHVEPPTVDFEPDSREGELP